MADFIIFVIGVAGIAALLSFAFHSWLPLVIVVGIGCIFAAGLAALLALGLLITGVDRVRALVSRAWSAR